MQIQNESIEKFFNISSNNPPNKIKGLKLTAVRGLIKAYQAVPLSSHLIWLDGGPLQINLGFHVGQRF